MYSYQVIQNLLNNKSGILNSYEVNVMVPEIRNCQKIYLGDFTDLADYFKSKPSGFFDGSVKLRLPFKKCWIDFHFGYLVDQKIRDMFKQSNMATDIDVTKHGLFCEEMFDDVISVHFFSFVNQWNKWRMEPYRYFISTSGNQLLEHSLFMSLMEGEEGVTISKDDSSIIIQYLDKNLMKPFKEQSDESTEILIKTIKSTYNHLHGLHYGLKLLRCRNIVYTNNYPDDKLNKKKIKFGKEPVYVYKTLMVRPLHRINENNSSYDDTKGLVKLHVVRGHFKEYKIKEDGTGGLFGKYEGLFWFQDHIAGNKEVGVIHKDYHLLTE